MNECDCRYKRGKLYEALARARLDYKNMVFVHQDDQDLDVINNGTTKALADQGLVFIQEIRDEYGVLFLYSTLGHSSGQEIISKTRILAPESTDIKEWTKCLDDKISFVRMKVSRCMLGVIHNNNPQGVEVTTPQGSPTEKISNDQLDELYYELEDYPKLADSLKKSLGIKSLMDMPKSKYVAQMRNIRAHKLALKDSPRSEW